MLIRRIFTSGRCLTRSLRQSSINFHTSSRRGNTNASIKAVTAQDLDSILAKPTWSVESLQPSRTQASDAPRISSKQLHHLLRLSALPLPKTPEDEAKMLDTLSAQLHFVGEIQQVDTKDVKPLRAIRDETEAAEREQTITLETLKDAFAKEQVVGKHHKRIQRDTTPIDAKDVEDWDVLGAAERKVGTYFVVESERPQE
ncbi:unnamed protein product [Periconia digitata]|uniref:Glutamyl-tRNA amidotransferase complex subunit Gta3 domain-containing protein n=1 Tax=Periconia digitata TaxID=1303443 RepID=A0A9W4XQ61_9PLEO|nr:unnamed protein product [Periconia digitata]